MGEEPTPNEVVIVSTATEVGATHSVTLADLRRDLDYSRDVDPETRAKAKEEWAKTCLEVAQMTRHPDEEQKIKLMFKGVNPSWLNPDQDRGAITPQGYFTEPELVNTFSRNFAELVESTAKKVPKPNTTAGSPVGRQALDRARENAEGMELAFKTNAYGKFELENPIHSSRVQIIELQRGVTGLREDLLQASGWIEAENAG